MLSGLAIFPSTVQGRLLFRPRFRSPRVAAAILALCSGDLGTPFWFFANQAFHSEDRALAAAAHRALRSGVALSRAEILSFRRVSSEAFFPRCASDIRCKTSGVLGGILMIMPSSLSWSRYRRRAADIRARLSGERFRPVWFCLASSASFTRVAAPGITPDVPSPPSVWLVSRAP